MSSWLPFTLFFGIVGGGITGLLVVGARRLRAYRDAVRALGLEYRDTDVPLARRLSGVLPVFDRGEVECLHVGKAVKGGIGLAVFEYVRRDPGADRPGRVARDAEGLVACLHAQAADGFDADRVTEWAEERKGRYRVECAGAWIAVQPARGGRGEATPTVASLQTLHADVQDLVERLTGAV